MPLLQLSWLDRRATHKRLNSTTEDDYGDTDDDYTTIATDVPIRIEQPEVDARQAIASDVVRWEGWILGTATAPIHTDRFEFPDGRVLQVTKVEDLTDFDGNLDHWQMSLDEIVQRVP